MISGMARFQMRRARAAIGLLSDARAGGSTAENQFNLKARNRPGPGVSTGKTALAVILLKLERQFGT
jgi:hypothetical protein